MSVAALVIEYRGGEGQAIGARSCMTPPRIRAVCRPSTRLDDGSVKASPKLSPTAPTHGACRNPLGVRARKPMSQSSYSSRWRHKTHNAEGILFDYRFLGETHWSRFAAGADGTRWYYQTLAEFFSRAMPGGLSDRLSRASSEFSFPRAFLPMAIYFRLFRSTVTSTIRPIPSGVLRLLR